MVSPVGVFLPYEVFQPPMPLAAMTTLASRR